MARIHYLWHVRPATMEAIVSNTPVSENSAPRRPGHLTRLLGRLFLKEATVAAARDVGGGFHVIELESPQFRAAAWSPGQKVQIAVGPSFTFRTYSPIEWDGERGRTRIIAYAHGEGPGSNWVRKAGVGDTCEVLGPRASLGVGGLAQPVQLFGDETSLGLAASIQQQIAAGVLRCLFEVESAKIVRSVLDLDSFGINDAKLYDRRSGDEHLQEIEASILDAAQETTFILTGKATSIQRIRATLKRHDVQSSRMFTKAYWAPGKKGLD